MLVLWGVRWFGTVQENMFDTNLMIFCSCAFAERFYFQFL